MTFEEVRNEYERQREEQRKTLAEYLSKHKGLHEAGLYVITGSKAGKGYEHYTAHGKISPFDLQNWKWVEVKNQKGFDCIISLNMLDIDPETRNIHSLYDRIGFVLSPAPEDWVYTDIDLPLDNTQKEAIAQLVLERFRSTNLSA